MSSMRTTPEGVTTHSIAARYRTAVAWLAQPPGSTPEAEGYAIALLAHMYGIEPEDVAEDVATRQPDAVRCPGCGKVLTEYQLAE